MTSPVGARLFTTPEAATFLGRRPATLRSWRKREIGPKFWQPAGKGTAALYTEADLEDFKKQLKD